MAGQNLYPLYFIDPPGILDAAVTNIPGSSSLPLQIVANSGTRAAHAIQYMDTTGDFIGLYLGQAGQEVLVCILGNGLTEDTPIVIPAYSRVSLRSLTTTPITFGKLTITFLGFGWNGQG